MKLFGSLKELVSLLFRKDGFEITVRPNQTTTYTAARDIQLPNANSDQELAGLTAAQTFTNKSIDADSNTITNIDDADIKAGAAINASKIADGSVSNTEFQKLNTVGTDASNEIVDTSSSQKMQNKQFLDGATFFYDQTDNTKKIAFETSGVSSGFTRTLSAPNKNITIAGIDDISDHSALTSGVHGVTGNVVGTTDTQTLSGKTFSQTLIPDADGTRDLGTGALAWRTAYINEVIVGESTVGFDIRNNASTGIRDINLKAGDTFGNKGSVNIQHGELKLNEGGGTLGLKITSASSIATSDKTLTIDVNNADRTLDLSGNLTTSGGNNLTFNTTGATNVTLPNSGTLVENSRTITAGTALSGGGDLSANRTIDLDITELTEDATPASGDYIVTYDVSGTAHKKAQIGNLPSAGVSSIGTIDSQTKSADGAVISGTNLVMQTADATNPGLITTAAQTLAGNKTLNAQWLSYSNDGTVSTDQTSYGYKTYNANSAYYGLICPRQGADANDVGLSFYSTVAGTPAKRMAIDPDIGDIVIGGTYSRATVQGGTIDAKAVNYVNGIMYSARNSTASREHIIFYNPNGDVGSIDTSASSTAYNTSSDYRLKENIAPMTDAVEKLMQLKPSTFTFKVDPSETIYGFIAHEVQEVMPQAITGEKDAVKEDGTPDYQGIDHSKLVPLLTGALQEALIKINDLEVRLAALETP